jgi:hypothetical protein
MMQGRDTDEICRYDLLTGDQPVFSEQKNLENGGKG